MALLRALPWWPKHLWHARQAADAVQVQWQQRAQGALDTQRIQADMQAQLKAEKGFTFYSKGDADKAEAAATRRVEASYSAPLPGPRHHGAHELHRAGERRRG